MAKTVVALYDDFDTARRAVQSLVDNGFRRDDLSIVASNAEGKYGTPLEAEPVSATAEGAGVGAVLGGLAGLLVGLGALAIPGIGPILAAGPLAAALAGAGIGAVTGGVVGALVDVGVPESEAEYYAEGVRRGGTLVTVQAPDDMAQQAADVMNSFHPADIRARTTQWRESGWTGFEVEPDTYPATMSGERQFEDYEPDFRMDYDARYSGRGYGYDRYRPAYLYGYQLGMDERFRNRAWSDLEPEIRRDWEMRNQERWDEVRDAVHAGWTKMHTAGEEQPPGMREGAGSSRVPTGPTYEVGRFEEYEPDFRRNYDSFYANQGYDYDHYRPAYFHGYNMALDERYRDLEWMEVEMEARQDWEDRNQGTWEEFKEAVREGWDKVRGGAY